MGLLEFEGAHALWDYRRGDWRYLKYRSETDRSLHLESATALLKVAVKPQLMQTP